jgi:O-methyltransferase
MEKIDIIRKTKSLFMKWRLHKVFGIPSKLLLNINYMNELSRWRSNTEVKGYNDWYQSDWDYMRREKLYSEVCKQEGVDKVAIDYFEFGVCGGHSFKLWLEKNQHVDSLFYGFDTFEGLPEAYGDYKAGTMNFPIESLNISDKRASFYKGLFQDTLIPFLEKYDNTKRKVIHMDADIFSATLFTFSQLHRFLNDGDIIMFDEFAVPTHEFMAFDIYIKSFYTKYEVIAAANNYLFVAVKIKK